MKRLSQHAFEPEEIMAYLDGELVANEAAALANHLEHCSECQAVATQLRQISERMLDFQVEPCPTGVHWVALVDVKKQSAVRSEMGRLGAKRRIAALARQFVPKSPLGWASVFGVLAILVIAVIVTLDQFPSSVSTRATDMEAVQLDISPYNKAVPPSKPASPMPSGPRSDNGRFMNPGLLGRITAGVPSGGRAGGGGGDGLSQDERDAAVPTRMIEQTASITIVASNYDQASKAVEQITTRHGGYVQDMNADTQTGTARSLSATVRVPEKQLESALADLGGLGHVEQESRSNQEVTDQYIDLTARLRNARAEERRILEILKTRTGKLADVLDAERELARVGGEIESMEGKRTYMEHEVSYATVQVQLNEVYRAQLNPEASSTRTRIRNSLVEGFRNLSDCLISIVVFVFAYGPSILLWLALVGLPAWFAWRRFRRSREAGST